MQTEMSTNLSELLADGIELGWMRQRTHDELSSFIERRLGALSTDEEVE